MPVKSRVKGNATFKILDILDSRKGARADYIADLNYYSPIEDKFDHVFCLEVMQFLWNPVQALNNMNSYLKDKGKIYVYFEFDYPEGIKGTDSLRFTKLGARELLEHTGFDIDSIEGTGVY